MRRLKTGNMTPLHKLYKDYPRITKGIVNELDDVLDKVREHYPNAYEEGSAGLARMYLDRETRLFVAYTWATPRHKGLTLKWNYLIFKKGKAW